MKALRGMGLTPNLIYRPIQVVDFNLPPSPVISGAHQVFPSPYGERWMHMNIPINREFLKKKNIYFHKTSKRPIYFEFLLKNPLDEGETIKKNNKMSKFFVLMDSSLI
eukprot:TRINITY_DN11586_c0_g2_i1.p1 TRINITY_DN11586_c0_g2~~TRINITY_DN11586_c0_g2_i1.p1  ORF type:complete len:108 (-),score=10.04 TRINITY_DN11586_c0_g2_i1:115-438(-)